jgi:putative endonuclease
MVSKIYFVYVITNFTNRTFYIGTTNNLERRIFEHRQELVDSFSKKYKLKKLVYFEEYINVKDALAREKQLKNWHRDWKINIIKTTNPTFKDLLEDAETSSA